MHRRYCAELVAACLKVGGLMSADSNPGAATPYSLYKLYKAQGAVMANPCTLRQEFGAMAVRPLALCAPPAVSMSVPTPLGASQLAAATHRASPADRGFRVASLGATPAPPMRRRSDSPPRMQFKVLQSRSTAVDARGVGTLQLSLTSLNMNNRTH